MVLIGKDETWLDLFECVLIHSITIDHKMVKKYFSRDHLINIYVTFIREFRLLIEPFYLSLLPLHHISLFFIYV